MAFIKNNFAKISSSLNNIVPRMWSYLSTTETLAQMKTTGYFGDVISEITPGDLIYIRGTDGEFLYKFDQTGTGTVISSDDRLISVTTCMDFSVLGEESEYFSYFGTCIPLACVLTNTTAATADYVIRLEIDSVLLAEFNVLNGDTVGTTQSYIILNAGEVAANKKARWYKTGPATPIELRGWVVSRLSSSSVI